MSKNPIKNSRTQRFEKRRKSTRVMTWLAGAGSLMVVGLITFTFIGGEDPSSKAKQSEKPLDSQEGTKNSDSKFSSDKTFPEHGDSDNGKEPSNTEGIEQGTTKEEEHNENEENKNPEISEEVIIKESNDENVERVIKKDWEPVITKQTIEGEHAINYDNRQSQDWQELLQAVRNATGLSEDNMITWWVGGKGPQKAVATVTDKDESKVYRVNIEWIKGKGYKPSRLEILKENKDKAKEKERKREEV